MARYREKLTGIKGVEFCEAPTGIKRKAYRGAAYQGKLFERKVLSELRKSYGRPFIKEPWIRFEWDKKCRQVCQPDGLLVDKEHKLITVVECKYTMTENAWFQLNNWYIPVLKAFRPDYSVRGVQIFKHYVPGIPYPTKPLFLSKADVGRRFWRGGHAVCMWKT